MNHVQKYVGIIREVRKHTVPIWLSQGASGRFAGVPQRLAIQAPASSVVHSLCSTAVSRYIGSEYSMVRFLFLASELPRLATVCCG